MVRDAVSIANHLELVILYINTIIFLPNRSIRTLSSVCWITIYPVGCRDLYVVIKINTLERVSSLLEHVI